MLHAADTRAPAHNTHNGNLRSLLMRFSHNDGRSMTSSAPPTPALGGRSRKRRRVTVSRACTALGCRLPTPPTPCLVCIVQRGLALPSSCPTSRQLTHQRSPTRVVHEQANVSYREPDTPSVMSDDVLLRALSTLQCESFTW